MDSDTWQGAEIKAFGNNAWYWRFDVPQIMDLEMISGRKNRAYNLAKELSLALKAGYKILGFFVHRHIIPIIPPQHSQ